MNDPFSSVDLSPSLVHHDPSDLGSLILIWTIPKEHSSRHKWGRGRVARMREKNGRLGDRDKGMPATKTPIFSSPPTDFEVIQLR